MAQTPPTDFEATATLPKVNRTVPSVEPPKTVLEFSASPTEEEFFRARVFAEPLVPIGGQPTADENSDLAAALLGYAKRAGSDDFISLTGFLEKHPQSRWTAALLTDLGLEYYNTAHYSLALDAWSSAWALAKGVTDAKGKAIADRAAGELAYMYARLGRMTELDALLKSVEGRTFVGSATEKISGAREGLWTMQNHPEIAFRCGPLALLSVKLSVDPKNPGTDEIYKSASTQQGFSLAQVAELSKKIGLNYQMAFREPGGAFVVPSVVHWKVGHYAALIRQSGDRYLLGDPTFRNDVWATKQALESETSGYFLIPPGRLPDGWRGVSTEEAGSVWGKGDPAGRDPGPTGPPDHKSPPPPCPGSGGGSGSPPGMAVSAVHFMTVNLNLTDIPVGYSPPVGPPVQFTVRYNHRDAFQPANFTYSNFGSKWTSDWISYITDNPQSLLADVNYYMQGGGTRTFTGFNPNTQSFAYQQYDETLLTRTGPASYEMLSRDGSKLVFSQSDGSIGTSRKIFLTQVVDPFGNVATLTYDVNLRLIAIIDAIGQVTMLAYGNANDIYKITRVTDPFGRFATFDYDSTNRLIKITDVIGLTSQFNYDTNSDFINALTTPYGTTTFAQSEAGSTRSLESVYPDGSRERVEYNQSSILGIPNSLPTSSLPTGMATDNAYLYARNTYYWTRTACATGYGDYTKAKIYHWLHTSDLTAASGILESTKEALEGRVWFNYAGQTTAYVVGTNNLPSKVARVLDDGSTQMFSYTYDGFGHQTSATDPLGRTITWLYATNGIDLLEIRQSRAGSSDLLVKMTYNSQHLPLTRTDAAGQTATYTYNARGQLLTTTNAKGEVTANTYDANGYLIAQDGPLPGTSDVTTATYDAFGRTRTKTDVSGYTLTFDYDALDRLTKITHPDGTFEQFTFNRLDVGMVQGRDGRQTLMEYDSMRQMKSRTDPLNRVTQFEWCSCGDLKTLIDPLGRTTSWNKDVQGRLVSKVFGDGSQINYSYENTTSRMRQVIDEKSQSEIFSYNHDNTLRSISYANAAVPTPGVTYTYDPDYQRITSMTDGTGITTYGYTPITLSPALGAGKLASEVGPLPNDTITYSYDELGRRVQTAINGVASTRIFDAAGRIFGETNALGSFSYGYDSSSSRLASEMFPNGQAGVWTYLDNTHDDELQQITYHAGATPISTFTYGQDIPHGRIAAWSQQAGAQTPSVYSFGYDAADQLLSGVITNAGVLTGSFAYGYDSLGNRLTESVNGTTTTASYNALNQINTTQSGSGSSRTNEWDAENRLTAVNSGNQRTEFSYDGKSRLKGIRQLVNGSETSHWLFVWCGNRICEERDGSGALVKRFFHQGVQMAIGPTAGSYFYTRDHQGSIRELTDGSGNVRVRYAYDPFGQRTKLTGDLDADFGFAGMFWSSEASLSIAQFRAYDPGLGRWLSRDPIKNSEFDQGPNLYEYAANNPVNVVDPSGLCCENLGTYIDALSTDNLNEDEEKERTRLAQQLQECLLNCLKKPPCPPNNTSGSPTSTPPVSSGDNYGADSGAE